MLYVIPTKRFHIFQYIFKSHKRLQIKTKSQHSEIISFCAGEIMTERLFNIIYFYVDRFCWELGSTADNGV